MVPGLQERQPAGEYNLAGVYLGAMVDTRALEKVSTFHSRIILMTRQPALAGMMLCYCFIPNETSFQPAIH